MDLLSRLSQLRISHKLLLFNILVTVVLGLVIGTAFLSFRHVQSLLTETVANSLEQLNTSGRISRGLSVVFADTNRLLETFSENQEYLDKRGATLLDEIGELQKKSGDTQLSQALNILSDTLQRTLRQCNVVNKVLQQLQKTDTGIWDRLDRLDENIADKLIDWVLRGEDPTILEQMATLVGGHRESMMEIGRTHAELWPKQYINVQEVSSLPIFSKIDNLVIRLHSMTAADEEIADAVHGLIKQLEIYKAALLSLGREMHALDEQRDHFNRTKVAVLALMEQNDQAIVQITQAVRVDLARKFRLVGTAGLLIGVILIAFIGFATTLFFRNILKRPMQLVIEGIQRFRRGELENRIQLDRSDEWSAIESALNAMASDLASSYANLENKITELEKNIVAREKAEEAVRRSEEKYRSIFENAVEGVYQITEGGNMLSANPAFARILGYNTAEDMISRLSDIGSQHYVNPADRQVLLQQLRRDGKIVDFEAQYRRLDGRVIWGLVNARYLQAPNNGEGRIEGIFQDISERKKVEEDKAALEEQLRQAQKMEAMGSLAGGIAHDFNNLLHAISGYLELLLMRKSSEDPDCKYLTEISRACERATEIAQRLLTFSRKMESKKILVDINEIVDNSLRIVVASVPKMISIETHLSPNPLQISTDPTQIEQVLLNLAGNAADAMPDGGKLLIETEAITLDSEFQSKHLEVEPGEYVLMKVTDSGTGMDDEIKSHIFEPFFTTKEVGKGTGLGLAIVYGIIKSFKGHVSCYSEPGVGTTFKIYLPAATREDEQQVESIAKFQAKTFKGKETVLVVDDEQMIREIAKEMLTTFDYTVLQADSGEEALQVYQERRYDIDLVILDLGMPGMGGEKCLVELIRLNPAIKVIVASGYAAHRIVQKPEEYGARKFISKPYQMTEMLQAIRGVLDSP